jgi:putative transport protein
MIDWIIETLKANTHLVIFLTLAVGYWVGKFKIGKFALGSVTGTLLAGVLIGQLGFEISGQVKTMFFTMFLFAVGYSVGPQFVQGVARDGLPQAIFGAVVSVLCLLCVYIAAKIAGFDVGLAAGLLAGSQTISASIGLATTAINSSGVENPEALLNQIPVAYAITYLWGTVGTGIILSVLGPKLLNVDIVEECRKYEAEMSKGTPAGGMNTAWQQLQMRAYRVRESGRAVGKTVSQLEGESGDSRLFVERLRRDGKGRSPVRA